MSNEIIENLEKKINQILALLLERSSSSFIKSSLPTITPMLYSYLDDWLNNVKAKQITPKSLAVLRCGVNLYIKTAIEDKPLNQCRASEMITAIEKCPYSYMKQVVYSIFRAVFKRAYQYDLINENPADKLDFVKHHRKKGKALTTDEQIAFIEAIQKERTKNLWMFYLLSGCRCNEALTLKWQDIDDKRKRIFIRGTKTEYSERYIPLFPQLEELLKEIPRINEFVFPFTLRQIDIAFRRIRKTNNFQFRIHDLRHTFATRCLELGITTKTVSKWLGHKHVNTTDEIYSHLLTEFELNEVKKFNLNISN